MPVYYKNKKNGEIEAKYSGCDTTSTLYRNTELYERIETKEELPLHKKITITPKREPEHESLFSKVKEYVRRRLRLS